MCLKFFKKLFGSTEQTHWVNYIYDETVVWPNEAMMWCNLHGFDEGPNTTYWIGMNIRTFGIRYGIRSADYVIKCKNKATYDRYINKASCNMEGILSEMKADPNLNLATGDDVKTEFVFCWGDEDKSFDVRLGWDWYAEEK